MGKIIFFIWLCLMTLLPIFYAWWRLNYLNKFLLKIGCYYHTDSNLYLIISILSIIFTLTVLYKFT